MADEGIKRLIELSVNAAPAIAELQKLNAATHEQTSSLNSLQEGLAKIGETIEQVKTVFETFKIAEYAAQFVENLRSMIEEMDQLGKSAQIAGVSVVKLQELQFALKLGAGLDAEGATAALTKFGNSLSDIGNKTSDAARVMREMGIKATDDLSTALDKAADVFSKAPDGINKTADAIELFGKKGAIMIPFLNQGSAGIADLSDELHKLGGVYDSDLVKQATEFDDNLAKLAQHSKELWVEIAGHLLPSLVELSAKFVQAAKDGNLLSTAFGRYWQNVEDFWTKTGRAMGMTTDATNEEVRDTSASFDKLAGTMQKVWDSAHQGNGVMPVAHENIEKVRKSAAQAKSDFEQWMDSMLKFSQADIDLASKVQWLTDHLAVLAKQGDTTSAAFKAWSAELLKLQPDPVATALLKLADAAKQFDDAHSDKMIEGLNAELVKLEAAGPAAGSAVKALHDQILKVKADSGDALAGVTLELEKMRIATDANTQAEQIWFDMLAKGQVTAEEFAKGVNAHLSEVSDKLKGLQGDTFDLAKAISDASAKFVTDFVDNFIDGIGAVHKSFTDMVTDMLKQLAKLIVQAEIAATFKSVQGSGGWGALFSGIGGAAQGAAWSSPGVQMMAAGGILTSPTFFASGGRLAVAGEAGPEAVVPLQRSASGDLGVAASPTVINIHNNAPTTVTTATSTNADGAKVIDVMITQKVKTMMSDGTMDKTMRSTYGLTRQPSMG